MARYKEIAVDLRRRLDAGEWRVGEQIASISQLQAEYDGPGLNVVRDAQSMLIGEGRLRAQQGVGVFVVAPPSPIPGAEGDGIGEELERIRQAATRAALLLQQQSAEDAVAVPEYARQWAWMTGVDCDECDLRAGSSRGWGDPDEHESVGQDEDRCQQRGHLMKRYYGPDPDADPQAAAAVERWRERLAHAEETARLLAAGTPASTRTARWHARQVLELTAKMPDELSYRIHVTVTTG